VVAAAVETAVGGARRADDARDFLTGDRSWEAVSGLVGLAWLPVMLVVLGLTVRQLGWFGRRTSQDAQSIAVAGATSHEWQWAADADLVVTWSNDRVGDLLGIPVDQVVGRPVAALLAEAGASGALRVMRAGVETGTGWDDVELDWRHADGHVVPLQGSASAIVDTRGRVQGLRGAHRPLPGAAALDRARSETRRRVQAVLDEEALQVAVQPICDLRTGEVVGFEALARFADASPEHLFALAEDVGLGRELELLAVRTALPLLDVLPARTSLAFNASPDLVLGGGLGTLLARPDADLRRLVLEITERSAVTCYAELNAVLAPLRGRGMRVAVDDTGAGYASFAHVLQLRPDVIKLDRSLISAIDTDPAQRSLVIAVALLALDLGATLTAEGVETEAQLRALADLGVDHGQGFHLGRPTLDLTSWLDGRMPTPVYERRVAG
jgi:EAL domain-containing protein (putative c-di-GMP-specific phosphodiesterase class I)/PAS domain-containing protein